MNRHRLAVIFITVMCIASCNNNEQKKKDAAALTPADNVATYKASVNLPQPYATKSVQNFSKVIGWPQNKTPVAPTGFVVTKYAGNLVNPRNIYIAKNGDVFVAESNTEVKGIKKAEAVVSGKSKSQRLGESANRITLLRDTNGDGIPDKQYVYLDNLDRPFGILILDNYFYVANTDALMRFPYNASDTVLKSTGKKILTLPKGGYNNHWTRNLLASQDGSKIFISVGSGSNAGEHGMANEDHRANILEINPDGSGEKIYASGLRNPVGMAWAPGTKTLWTSVNERDELGDELVPDYLTSVKEGGFYGWPYSYYGQHADPRLKDSANAAEMMKKAIVPDVSLGAHTASLGLIFYKGNEFPQQYHGAFIGQHGSWNRSQLSGYKVVFVPFKNGEPSGKPQDFLTGFIEGSSNDVYGRPVNLAVTAKGDLLLADDSGNTIWKISYKG